MHYGNMTVRAKTDEAMLERRWCPACKRWVLQSVEDESFSDGLGTVTEWVVYDICPDCEGPTDEHKPETETEGSDMVEQPQEQRCNACMTVFDESETACPSCGRDDALMCPFEDNAQLTGSNGPGENHD